MLIQYVSDIHLEFYNENIHIHFDKFVKPGLTPYLVLCGDIGNPSDKIYKAFIKWCSERWKDVFIIAGNHEYYNLSSKSKSFKNMNEKKELIKNICTSIPTQNVQFLDCNTFWLQNDLIRVIGCTLWSNIDDEVLDHDNINDNRQIMYNNINVNSEFLRDIHFNEKRWLNNEINKCALNGEKCIVITHYLPSYKLISPKHINDGKMNSYFASACEDLIHPPILAWFCGHTHTGTIIEINNVPCLINPVGYPGENSKIENSKIFMIE